MYLESVLSYLGAWDKIRTDHANECRDILSAIDQAWPTKNKIVRPQRESKPLVYASLDLKNSLVEQLNNLNWSSNNIRLNELSISRDQRMYVDLVKNGIGISIAFNKRYFAESAVFVRLPLFIKAGNFQIGLYILSSKSMHESLPQATDTFETVRDRFIELGLLNLNFPFAMLGITDIPTETRVEELTSNLDLFLTDRLGMSLLDMRLIKERANFDFKQQLPDNQKIAKEVCAFANYEKGGLMLVGIDNDANVIGLPRDELDKTQLKLSDVIRTNCTPPPEFELRVFDADSKVDSCVLVVDIYELERKPCMVNEKVYIRVGASAVPAKPDDIRRLLLGKLG